MTSPRTARPLLILKTGATHAHIRERLGDFDDWIASGLSAGGATAMAHDARTGVPPAPDTFSGVVITGSHAMVSDREPWSEALVPWLQTAVALGVPTLGICYGHQLLAHALGGQVDYNPAGRESGTIRLELAEPAATDPLFAGLPASFPAHATHLQTVLRPPDGATVLARSAQDGCHAFRWGENAWGVQFHPEFATHHMRGYVRARADCIARHGGCAHAVSRQVSAAPQARRLLRRFVRHARGHA